MQVTIAGSGGWGTALAILLHENGHDVTLWSHFETESKQLAETHQNPYLPGVTLPEGLHYSADPRRNAPARLRDEGHRGGYRLPHV